MAKITSTRVFYISEDIVQKAFHSFREIFSADEILKKKFFFKLKIDTKNYFILPVWFINYLI